MKRISVFLAVALLLAGLLYAAQQQGQGQAQGQGQEFKPLLANVRNDKSAQNAMLSNTYSLKVILAQNESKSAKSKGRTRASQGSPVKSKGTVVSNEVSSGGGQAAAFRLTKNWFLTCAHGPFQTENPHNKGVLRVDISVEDRSDAPGAAPFYLVIDMTRNDQQAKGRVYLFNRRLKLDATNNGRGEDLALIYVPDPDLDAKTEQLVNQTNAQMNALAQLMGSKDSEQLNAISQVYKKQASVWDRFFNYPIKPYHLFILDEKTIIQELGYPGKTRFSFPLTAYYIQEPTLTTFSFVPIGTHAGTDAIFYKRVSDLIHGTSGSPMTYGNFVVSVDSATNCSPMLTPKFHRWLKRIMGKDYQTGMCVEPTQQAGGGGKQGELKAPTDPRWNDARP